MEDRLFHCTRIGASHIKKGLPCQDVSASGEICGRSVAVVADGHGSRRHFRSDRGAEIACQTVLREVGALLSAPSLAECTAETQLLTLRQNICRAWSAAVLEDLRRDPWTEAELAEAAGLLSEEEYACLTREDGSTVPYGSTVCAVIAGPDGWAAIQLGDGAFVKISADGAYSWPMPASLVNEGHLTASLCMEDPMADFRACMGGDHPAGLIVYTDGIEKVLPSGTREVTSLLHWIWRDMRAHPETENLAGTLDMLTQRSRIGDDLSVAGIVDLQAPDHTPQYGLLQRDLDHQRRLLRIQEIESTIAYSRKRLVRLRLEYYSQYADPDAQRRTRELTAQLETILSRRERELKELKEGTL